MPDITAKEGDGGQFEKASLKVVNSKDSYAAMQLRAQSLLSSMYVHVQLISGPFC